ncbi:MAG: YbaN family protein [Pseudomonadota bacterium]
MRALYLIGGWLCLGLGFLGALLPLLPTTPFVLLAAYCFARSSPTWHRWLLTHRLFGPLILDWQTHRALRRGAKWSASGACGLVLALSLLIGVPAIVLGAQVLALSLVLIFLWRLPEPPMTRRELAQVLSETDAASVDEGESPAQETRGDAENRDA